MQLLDYELKKGKNLKTGQTVGHQTCQNRMCCSLYLRMEARFSARPSGTEPKIKFYFSVNTKLKSAAEFDKTNAALDEKIKAIISDMKL